MYQITVSVLLLLVIKWNQASRIVDTRTISEKRDRDVVLACRFEQLQEGDRVMWSKDDVVLSMKEEISGDRKKYEITGKYDLIIKTVVSQDSGRYVCQNFDQAVSINVLLTVLTPPSKPDLQQTNKSLIENQVGRFLCVTQGGNPLPTFNWSINQVKLNETLYRIYPSTRQSYSELYLPLEKRFHNGSLICQVENQALDKPLTTSYALNIQYKPEMSLRVGKTMASNLNLLVIENDRLTIDCYIESNPPLIKSITWLKNGVAISTGSSPSLTLQSIKRSDDGEYTCLSANSIGQSQSSVHIRVQYSPIVELNGGGIINERERLILVCNVNAYPTVDYYQWYKNNEKLNTTSLTSSIIIEKVSTEDAGTYVCMVKNTLKYSNGSSNEQFNKTQTRVIVQYAPKVYTDYPIIAADLQATEIKFSCEIDSYPEATIIWKFKNKVLFNSNKYSITQNKSFSYLILREIQSTTDYGVYSCNATNKLGYNSTTIQLRSKDAPDSPRHLKITSISYSTISVNWQQGFDGGWPQSFWISLDNALWKETNQTHFTFTNLQHLEYYNITVRAHNQLGPSSSSAFLRIQTKDIPIEREDLPTLEHASLHSSDNTIHYRLNDSSFLSVKVPLCLRLEISNQTYRCQRLVTSSGVLKLDTINLKNKINVSICLDQYESFCGESVAIDIKRETLFNWLFILVSSIVTVFLLILLGLCIFCLISNRRQQRRRRRNITHTSVTISNPKSSQYPVIVDPLANSSIKFFSNLTYPEQQQIPSSYLKLDQLQGKLSNGSNDPIISNPNSSSLSSSNQLTVTDVNQTDLSSVRNHLSSSSIQNNSYGFPLYTISNKEDHHHGECLYSIPLKNDQSNKKTVYEVVV